MNRVANGLYWLANLVARKMSNQIDRYYRIRNIRLMRSIGVTYGSGIDIIRKVTIELGRGAEICIGDNFVFRSCCDLNPLSRGQKGHIRANEGASIKIGNRVGISSSCIWAHQSIDIGDRVSIGANSMIVDSDCHSLDYRHRGTIHDLTNKLDKPIIIEDDVLVGAGVIILKGVTIGARSVIGAGSVVAKSIPPDTVAAGNPCKVIRRLEFPESN